MKNIYFVGIPIEAKGINDFNYIAEHVINAKFFWFSYKVDIDLRKKYKRINFIIGLDDDNLKAMITKEMDLLICCSHFEGFCLPIAEAILLGKPVFSYKLKEIESVYLNSINYVDCFDLNSYVDKINKFTLKDDSSNANKKHINYIINNYSPRIVSKRLLKILLN